MRALFATVILALYVAAPAAAQDVADFYRGKTVAITVGYPPASGYTFFGQLLARSLGAHLPGNPNVIVQGTPGAGSVKAASYLYKDAPRDGTVIGMLNIGALVDELFGATSVGFDTTKFAWIGNMDQSVGVCVVNGSTGITRFADLMRRDTVFGGTGPSGGATQAALTLTRLFGARIRLVKGYPGAEDIVQAIERGEVEGGCGLAKAVLMTRLSAELKSGALRPIVHDAMASQPDLPGVPSIYELAKSARDRDTIELLFGWRVLARPVAAPPAVPSERLDALQAAFLKAMADPGLIAEAEKANLNLVPSTGAEVADLIARLFSHPKETIVRAAAIVRNN